MNTLKTLICESFPPRPAFSVDNIPDLTGKVVIVTGGGTGIGKETVRALLTHGARVYIAARNKAQCQNTIRELEQDTGREAIHLSLDLANLKAVKAAAEAFLRKESQLHVLFNNAGVMRPPIEWLTAEGYDLQFGTNVLGHHYLTKLLLPTMIATAKTSSDGRTRVITSSSSLHLFGRLDFDTFKDSPKRRKHGSSHLYCQSKFANVVVARELARRYGGAGIISISLNPGNIKSDLQRHFPSSVQFIMDKTMLYDTPFGALTQLCAGTMPGAVELGGKYLVPWARIGTPLVETQDPDLGEKLWGWLEEQVNV